MILPRLIAPLALGMWIRYRWPSSSKVMDKIIVPFTLCTIVFILTAGVYINLYVFELITGPMVAAGFIVAAAGYLVGGGLAWLCRLAFKISLGAGLPDQLVAELFLALRCIALRRMG